MFEKIPEELKRDGKFCLWRSEKRDGKTTKVPYRTDGKHCSSTNPDDFAPFGDAVAAWSRGGYDGIGLMVESNISAIDIDHCWKDGKLTPMAQEIVDTMDSYTETSPSGNGLHIIFNAGGIAYGKDRYYINNRNIGLEVYVAGATDRYVTVTGNVVRSRGIEMRGEQLLGIAEKYMRRSSNAKTSVIPPGSCLEDEELIKKAMSAYNGDKFRRLFNGDTSGYASASNADLALFGILAYWCGGNTEQMLRIANTSSLRRDKWKREDYIRSTVKKAVDGCREFYKPAKAPPTDTNTHIAEAPVRISSPDSDIDRIADTLCRLNIVKNGRYSATDVGSGRLFADVFKDVARYNEDRKRWMIYDGNRWVADTAGLRVAELGKKLADSLAVYLTTLKDEDDRAKITKWIGKWVQHKFRSLYIQEAQSIYPVRMHDFDSNPFLLNCRNCTINLKTQTVHEHDPEDLITKMCPVDYDENAAFPRWDTYIFEIMSGDTEKARYLQKSLGYALSGDAHYECLFIYFGETTRNGKGTLMESILTVMGDYGITVRAETIAQKSRSDSHAPTEDIARLAGIRFANISEPNRGLVVNAAQLKTMTGNDTLNARFLNENSFDFKPQFKLYINTNYLPVITDMTVFSSNRIVIVPFNRHFNEEEQDHGLKRAFMAPTAQSAILNWLLDGYRLLMKEGLTQPDPVKEAIASYYHESNKVEQFIENSLIKDPAAEVKTSEVYERYRSWCADNGTYTENMRNFQQELRKVCQIDRKRPASGGEKTTLVRGYRLRDSVNTKSVDTYSY